LIGEPPPSQGDLHFSVLGIPVRVHPLFWLVTVLLGLRSASPQELLLWVVAVFFSILVHELGHALAVRACGWEPTVVLYSFGGLAIYRPTYDDPKKQIFISLAGPGAGFCFGGIIVLLLMASDTPVSFALGGNLGIRWNLTEVPNENLRILLHHLIYVNLFWGLLNLLPIYPLDGGHVARELLTMGDARQGMIRSMQLSIVVALCMIVFVALRFSHPLFGILMFGYFAYLNWMMLRDYSGRGGFGGDYW
jgi:stage IV sporulation protein FB